MSFKELSSLIKARRAIYPNMYIDKPIADLLIVQILENANWAPTHKKTEPWRFKIFKGESLHKLSSYLGDYYSKHTPKEKFSEIKLKKTLRKPLQSGCVIAICMYNDPNVTIPEWEEIAAVSCAVQNMWLSCTTLNIGCYWSSPASITNAKDFLGLSENERCLGLFYMGYTNATLIPGQRKPIQDKIEWLK
ncbi:MAG: nitroreductase [Saprospiraceae bacterium]|nr:nitroreductase [Saprospiraceae bacterium]